MGGGAYLSPGEGAGERQKRQKEMEGWFRNQQNVKKRWSVCSVAWKGQESYEGYGDTEKCVFVQKHEDRITIEPRQETERHKAGTSEQPVAPNRRQAGRRNSKK